MNILFLLGIMIFFMVLLYQFVPSIQVAIDDKLMMCKRGMAANQ